VSDHSQKDILAFSNANVDGSTVGSEVLRAVPVAAMNPASFGIFAL
jgi:hypothetical protein